MKDFFSELFYMCSANNEKSRGLYIFITAAIILLAIGIVASIVLLIINIVKGYSWTIFAILLAVQIILEAGVIFWLKKS